MFFVWGGVYVVDAPSSLSYVWLCVLRGVHAAHGDDSFVHADVSDRGRGAFVWELPRDVHADAEFGPIDPCVFVVGVDAA